MSQLKQLTIETITGGQQTLTLQDYDSIIEPEYYGDNYDRAISGKLRHRLRGQREVFTLRYSACLEQSEYRTLYNNIISDIQNNDTDFSVSEGASLSDIVVVTVTDEFRQQVQYANQIGTFSPTIEFITSDINAVTGQTYVEAGYVATGYVQ